MRESFGIRCILAFTLGVLTGMAGQSAWVAVIVVLGVDIMVRLVGVVEHQRGYNQGWSDLHAKVMPLVHQMADTVKDKT